jgi:NAD(P)-dependent dehydrogenase (short-subunit alcohol dehydrogenase family)
MNRLDLEGKTAIVTGASAGLGLGIAKRLAQSGARLALWDRDKAALAGAARELSALGEVHAVTVDVAVPDAVLAAARQSLERLGGIEVLVNNAGISGPNAPTWEYPLEDWRRVLDINLTGVFLCCRAVVPHMLSRGYGRIVNIASVSGKEGNPNAPAYSASKGGVIALTKALGKELARSNVLVNCVTPGAVRTAIFDQMSEEHVQFMLSKIPLGRFGQVEEIAALVAWLCTEECSFSTGAVFDLSGGRATY